MNEHTELLVATNNAGKVRELSQLLSNFPRLSLHLRLRLLSDFPHVKEAIETGETFTENAVIKAQHYSTYTGLLTLSDDSGLAVDALGGAPGVYSARYAGHDATYAERMSKLLGELDATGDEERHARFVCVIAVADPSAGTLHTFEGECRGRIARAPRGTGGFGYDPVFIPDGYTQTFGELPTEFKHTLSHRARALQKVYGHLRQHYT